MCGRGCDHQLETLLCGREFWDVVIGVGSTNVFLHGAISLLLSRLVSSNYGRVEDGLNAPRDIFSDRSSHLD